MDPGPSTRPLLVPPVCSANPYPKCISTDNFASENVYQSPATAAAALPSEQEASSMYPLDVTPYGQIEPYGRNGSSIRTAKRELGFSSTATLHSVPHSNKHRLMHNQGVLSTVLPQESRGYRRGEQTNGLHQGFGNNGPQRLMYSLPQTQVMLYFQCGYRALPDNSM